MPIYEFECADCGARFEELLRVADAPRGCPSCGGEARRQLSVFATRRSTTARGSVGGASAGSGGCACGGACACGA